MPHRVAPTRVRVAVVAASAVAGLAMALLTARPAANPAAARGSTAPGTTVSGGAPARADGAATAASAVSKRGADIASSTPPASAVLASATVPSAVAAASRSKSSTSSLAAATRPQPATTTTPRPISFGVYSPGFPGGTSSLDQLASLAGRSPGIVMWYVHWGGPWSAFNANDVQTILARGATPMITWMTDDPTASSPLASLSPSAVAAGADDAYIRSWATGLRSVGGTVMIRLDHEMNGNWCPWSPGVNGTTSAQYVSMWRHVHRIFVNQGATNVRWVWSPNVEYPGSTPLSGLYPGNQYVDVVGLDGYNWGTSQPGKQWQTFDQIFDSSINDVHRISSRPLLITEVASTSSGGDKAAWITDFLATLLTRSDITGFVWFDANKETDWRFEETSATTSAFSAGLLRFS